MAAPFQGEEWPVGYRVNLQGSIPSDIAGWGSRLGHVCRGDIQASEPKAIAEKAMGTEQSAGIASHFQLEISWAMA
jgi:hypothetical protein